MTTTLRQIDVDLADHAYPIRIDHGLLSDAGWHIQDVLGPKRLVIVADRALEASGHLTRLTGSLADAGLGFDVLTLDGGERSKSFEVLSRLMGDILSLGVDRRIALIAFGGGVIGDLAGFAAAILLRGVDLIQIPTTLLSQVDSSVGGKTGINTPQGKNLVGSFHQPKLVLIDTSVLDTLPIRELKAGYAEVIKYGCLADAAFFEWLELHAQALLDGDMEARAFAIQRCCEIKAAFVKEDPFETTGKRALLNFGHTFAHGYEALAGYGGVVLHGEAVSVGMTRAALLSARCGVADDAAAARLIRHLRGLGMPVVPGDLRNERFAAPDMIEVMRKDKKAEAGAMTFILWHGIGQAFVDKHVDERLVEELLEGDD